MRRSSLQFVCDHPPCLQTNKERKRASEERRGEEIRPPFLARAVVLLLDCQNLFFSVLSIIYLIIYVPIYLSLLCRLTSRRFIRQDGGRARASHIVLSEVFTLLLLHEKKLPSLLRCIYISLILSICL